MRNQRTGAPGRGASYDSPVRGPAQDPETDAESSSAHPAIAKRIRALHLAKRCAETGMTLVEGPKLVHEALASGARIVEAAVTEALALTEPGRALQSALDEARVPVVLVSDRVLAAAGDLESPRGIVAVVTAKRVALEALARPATAPLLVVAVGIQDPGNAGALVRTVEAFGASGLVALGGADPWGPKAVRGSAGSIFRVPVATSDTPIDAVALLRERGYTIAAAVAEGGEPPEAALAARPLALVVGSEGSGLPGDVLDRCDVRVTIPLRAPVESLNVAAAAAVLLYATSRATPR